MMRDGSDAYVRSDGSPIDYEHAAYIENQALAYHALDLAAHVVFPDHAKAPVWLTDAHNLRDATIEQFWMPQHSFFAAAIDRYGQVDMLSSAVFELLDSPFFLGLKEGNEHVENLVRSLYDEDTFMTPIGARMVSLEQAYLEGDSYYAYQGSGAVWPVTTGIIANGLRRWGLHRLAHDLGYRRMVGGIEKSNEVSEFTNVHRISKSPMYRPAESVAGDDPSRIICPSDKAQLNQAWTASAALRQLNLQAEYNHPQSKSMHLSLLDEGIHDEILRDNLPTASDSTQKPYRIVCDYQEGAQLKKDRAADLKGKKSRPREI
ncbi:MAG: hypothetical protein EOO17_05905 [Chloroflexi bacterium]|nr:MAG: hypothetical protein EOO17_05905 [Chloroflexota bacterium]